MRPDFRVRSCPTNGQSLCMCWGLTVASQGVSQPTAVNEGFVQNLQVCRAQHRTV